MTMQKLVDKLVDKNIIEVLTKEIADRNMLKWYNENYNQYIIEAPDKMMVYTNDDGFITDIFGISKQKDKWFLVTFQDDFIEIDDFSLCDLSLWNKQELELL